MEMRVLTKKITKKNVYNKIITKIALFNPGTHKQKKSYKKD